MYYLPNKPYSDSALRDYIQRQLALVGDDYFTNVHATRTRDDAVETSFVAFQKFPNWLQVLIVETDKKFEAVPSSVINPEEYERGERPVFGQYDPLNRSSRIASQNIFAAYIFGHENAHHADRTLGENGVNFSSRDPGWIIAVNQELAFQQSLSPSKRHHERLGSELYSRITDNADYRGRFPSEVFAAVLSDYIADLSSGKSEQDIDRELTLSLPFAWPYFREEILPRLMALSLEKYNEADRKIAAVVERLNVGREEKELSPVDIKAETKLLHDLRAQFDRDVVDRAYESFGNLAVVILLPVEYTINLSKIAFHLLEAECPYPISQRPEGLCFEINAESECVALQFYNLFKYYEDKYIPFIHYVNGNIEIKKMLSGTANDANDAIIRRSEDVETDKARQSLSYSLIKYLGRESNADLVNGLKIVVQAFGQPVKTNEVRAFFEEFITIEKTASVNQIVDKIARAARPISEAIRAAGYTAQAIIATPQFQPAIRRGLATYAKQNGGRANSFINAVSYFRKIGARRIERAQERLPLIEHLDEWFRACGVTAVARANIKERIYDEMLSPEFDQTAQYSYTSNFLGNIIHDELWDNAGFQTRFLTAFSGHITALSFPGKMWMAGRAVSEWRSGTKSNPGAWQVSAGYTYPTEDFRPNPLKSIAQIAVDFGMDQAVFVYDRKEIQLLSEYVVAGNAFFKHLGFELDVSYFEAVFNTQDNEQISQQIQNLKIMAKQDVTDWWQRINYFYAKLREHIPEKADPLFLNHTAMSLFHTASAEGQEGLIHALEAQELVLSEMCECLQRTGIKQEMRMSNFSYSLM